MKWYDMKELDVDREIDLKKKIVALDDKSISQLAQDLGINIQKDYPSKELLSEDIIQEASEKNQLEKLHLTLKFLEAYPKVDTVQKDLLVRFFPPKLRKEITSKTSKEELISLLKDSVINKSLSIEQLNNKSSIYAVISKVKKVNKDKELVSLSRCIWGITDENVKKDEIIKRIASELERNELQAEKIEKCLENIKIQTQNNKPKSTNEAINEARSLNAKVLEMENRIKLCENSISELNISIKKLIYTVESNNQYVRSFFENVDKNVHIDDTEKLISELRKEDLNLISFKKNSFNALLESLRKQNISDMDLLKNGLAVVIIDYLMKVTKEIEWDVSLDAFYKILSKEVLMLKNSVDTVVEIPIVREQVCTRMNIQRQKFDSLLKECWENNWVNLEVGTPIGETDAGWLDTGKNRFYYLKLVKK